MPLGHMYFNIILTLGTIEKIFIFLENNRFIIQEDLYKNSQFIRDNVCILF